MISFVLNLPYTLLGIISALVCIPKSVTFHENPYAIIFDVRNCWWSFLHSKYLRACTIGHIIILTPKTLKNDFKHELIHVQQYEKYPLIFPLLYYWETFKHGYRKNRFEDEAYCMSKSIYRGNETEL